MTTLGSTVVVQLVVPGDPVAKARPRLAAKGHVYTPARTVRAEERLLQYLKAAYPRLVPVEGPVSVSMDFYAGTHRRVDLDNFQKLALDALNHRAYVDDSQVVEIHARKYTGAKFPRTEVTVWLVPHLGGAA